MGVVSLCLSRQDASTDMQHNPLRSTCDLDLRSNFDPDLSRSPYICFDAPCREEYDCARIMPLIFLVQKLFAKNRFAKTTLCAVFWPLLPKPLTFAQILKLNQIWWLLAKEQLKCYQMLFFCGLLTKIFSEIMVHFRRNMKFAKFDILSPMVAYGGLNIDLSKKSTKNTFVMLSNQLSNALFGFSLRCLEAELQGRFSTTPHQVV